MRRCCWKGGAMILEIASGGPESWQRLTADRYEIVGDFVYLFEVVAPRPLAPLPIEQVCSVYKLNGLRLVAEA